MKLLNDLNLNFNTLENSVKTIIVVAILVTGILATYKEIFIN